MKNSTTARLLLPALVFSLATSGCSLFHHHSQPKSSFKIIPAGERNPSITETPEVVKDTPTQKIEVETGPVGAQ